MSKEKKNKKRKMKKGIRRLLIILILLVLLGIIVFYLINNFTSKAPKKTVKVIDEISEYGYTLDDNETKLYKDLFKQLSKTLSKDNIDEKEYSELVCKLFVADFYNLDNKITKNDVGGTQFIHSEAVDNFVLKAKDTLYKGVKSDIYGDREQDLPIVTEINLDEVKNTTFKYNDSEVDAYSVILNWKYKTDLDYDDEKEFVLIKEEKKLSIVELNNVNKNTSTDKN